MGWAATDIPDQSGKVAVVTGANGGLGLEVTRELARKGGHGVMAVRDLAKAEAARNRILLEVPAASLELQELDLASLDSVREAATQILRNHPTIDVLVNNAGLMGIPEQRTVDGFEMQFGVNHLGHFALTARLLPALLRSPQARVVSVTSTGRHAGRPVDPDNPHLVDRYDPWRAYGQSKLANVHFALELQGRFEQADVRGEKPRRASRIHLHGPAGPKCSADAGRAQSALLLRRGPAIRDVPLARRPLPPSRSDRPCRQRRLALHASVCELGPSRATAAVLAVPRPSCDGHSLGGLRARDRHHLRRRGGRRWDRGRGIR